MKKQEKLRKIKQAIHNQKEYINKINDPQQAASEIATLRNLRIKYILTMIGI